MCIRDSWEIALKSKNNPSAIALSRQKLPYVSEHSAGENMCSKGAYVLKKTSDNADISLIASGSEVEIALEAQEKLKGLNINSKVISVPCYDLFQNQTENYKDEILGKDTFKISIEASSQTDIPCLASESPGNGTFPLYLPEISQGNV